MSDQNMFVQNKVDLGKTPKDKGTYFFISYKHDDTDRVKEVVKNLNCDVWYDVIPTSSHFDTVITQHIIDCKAVIFFASEKMLAQGKPSYPYIEYQLALEEGKQIIVVFIDDINKKNVHIDLKKFFIELKDVESIGFGQKEFLPNRLSELINKDISRILDSKPAKRIESRLISNYSNNEIVYLGNSFMHLILDKNLICLFNKKTGNYELRYITNLNAVYKSFYPHEIKKFSSCRPFISSNTNYLFFCDDKTVYIRDFVKEKTYSRTIINFLTNSSLSYCFESDGNIVYFLTSNNRSELFDEFIKFDLQKRNVISRVNLANCMFNVMVKHIKNNNMDFILFINTNNELCVFDIISNKVYKYNNVNKLNEIIQSYYNQSNNILDEIDGMLSHDGLMYAVNINGGYNVINTENGSVRTILDPNLCNIYLLKNGTVITYDTTGTVVHYYDDGTSQKVMKSNYFTENPEFCGNIPFNMSYDEIDGNNIFVVKIKSSNGRIGCKLVVVNKRHRVLGSTELLEVPFSDFDCQVSIQKDKIFVCFDSIIESEHQQNTVVYVCDYERKKIKE